MSKQKKEKQPPVLGRLLAYAGGHKWLSVLGCGLSGVSAAAGIFPFVFVWYAARGILTPGGGVPAGLARYGWYALAAALLSAAIYFAGLMCTHLAAFRRPGIYQTAAPQHPAHAVRKQAGILLLASKGFRNSKILIGAYGPPGLHQQISGIVYHPPRCV